MTFFQNIFSHLFPPACVICQKDGSLFCKACQNEVDFLYFTPQLTALSKYDINIQSLGFYTPPLASVIKTYKYQGIYHLAPILAKLLYKHLHFSPEVDYITYIPLHPKKYRQRGFNQTELLANELSLLIHKPVLNLFTRKKHTQSLASTQNQLLRQQLTKNLFALKTENLDFLYHKQILILDDVVTSGTTFASCMQLLKSVPLKTTQLVTLAHEG